MALDTNKITLARFNAIDRCILSGGSYTAEKPLSNAQIRDLAEYCRTTDTAPANTQFEITLDKRRTIGYVGIAGHNLTVDALARVRVYDDEDEVVHDSGWFLVWPAVLGIHQVAWGDPNFWNRQPDVDDRAEYKERVDCLFEPVSSTYSVLVEIDDEDNPDGYIEFSRPLLCEVWQPTTNMSFGSQWGYEDTSTINGGDLPGVEFYRTGPRKRTFSCELERLEADEAFNEIARMQNVLGITGEVVVFNDLRDTPQRYSKTMLARMTELNPITHPHALHWRAGLAFLELT